jgi:hypothetical protein
MATIHIREIQRILSDRGETDALPHSPGGYFLAIRFDDSDRPAGPSDPELANKAISAESRFGSVVIQFDQEGQLQSIDLS